MPEGQYSSTLRKLRKMNIVSKLILWILIESCSCKRKNNFDRSVPYIPATKRLSFTSNKCNEEPIKVGRYGKYILTWNGQIHPRLCRLSFSSQLSNYEVCFKSTVYTLPYRYGNPKLNIKNHTKSLWVFDKDFTKIDYTCVSRAHKMMVSLEIPPGYREPASMTYLQMEFTAEIVQGKVTKSKASFGSFLLTAFSMISVVVLIVFIYICAKADCKININIGDLCSNICKCCSSCICYYITCECFDGYSCPSRDCNCSAMLRLCNGRCLSFLIRNRDEDSNNQINVQQTDAIHEISDTCSNLMSLEGEGPTEPPPSYHAVVASCLYENPTSPPPSYEDVTKHSTPSAGNKFI